MRNYVVFYLASKREKRRLKRLRERRARKIGAAESLNKIQLPLDLNLLRQASKAQALVNKRERRELSLPQTFSLIDQPAECLKACYALAQTKINKRFIKFRISHKNVKNLDLGAEAVLGYVADLINRARQNYTTKYSGRYPDDPALSRLVQAVGLVRMLEDDERSHDVHHRGGLHVFRINRRSNRASVSVQDNEATAARRLTRYIDKCLRTKSLALTEKGVNRHDHLVTEVLENVAAHSGQLKWNIYGYLDDESGEAPCLQLVIFNLGKTIAETFLELPEDSFPKLQLMPYVQHHRKAGLFGQVWSEKNLITLAALQGDVSSKNSDANDDRGQGTVKLIRFFQEAFDVNEEKGAKQSRMLLISGKTAIRFDGRYRLSENIHESEIIAFNEENDLFSPPDRKYVFSLSGVRFPGTLIAFRFLMPKSFLGEVHERN